MNDTGPGQSVYPQRLIIVVVRSCFIIETLRILHECEAVPSIYLFFTNEFNKFINA